jgi:chromosome partitioning protein
MGKIIALANQKGGVGKTTSAVNIAASLGVLGYKVLLADLDPQGSATSSLGIAKKSLRFTMADLLIGGCRAQDAILPTHFENLDLLPANIHLAATEYDLLEGENAENHSRSVLLPLKIEYDFIILDCPPSLGMLTVNAMVASDGVIIPMQCEFFALEGLSQLMLTISRMKKRYRPTLTVTGILVTMYNSRLTLSGQVLAELKKHYGDQVFQTTVSRNVKLSEAPGFGVPAYYHDKGAKGVKEYLALAQELLQRI